MMRAVICSIYVTAAGTQLLLLLLVVMPTAFAGVNGRSAIVSILMLAVVCCMTALAAAGASVLADQYLSSTLLILGPVLSFTIASTLYFTSLRGLEHGVMLLSPSSIVTLAATVAGALYMRSQKAHKVERGF